MSCRSESTFFYDFIFALTPLAYLSLTGSAKKASFSRLKTVLSFTFSFVFLLNLTLLVLYLRQTDHGEFSFGLFEIFSIPSQLFESLPRFHLTSLGLTYGIMSSCLFGIAIRFALSGLAADYGIMRFFTLMTLLSLGIQIISYSENLATLFVGWEFVGFSSVFLISFFRTHQRALDNSLRALVFYRIGDGALLVCLALTHATPNHLPLIFGLLLIIASLDKAGQLPFSNWLFRAMEGPSASSAIYYGALASHLGPFLLLHSIGIWADEPLLRFLLGFIGVSTFFYSYLVGATRSDVKTALAYSTQGQIGLQLLEISMGFYTLALTHLVLHAFFRTWQYLKSASLIQDYTRSQLYRNSLIYRRKYFSILVSCIPTSLAELSYGGALRGFFLDDLQHALVVRPFLFLAGQPWLAGVFAAFFIVWQPGSDSLVVLGLLPIFFVWKKLSRATLFIGITLSQFACVFSLFAFESDQYLVLWFSLFLSNLVIGAYLAFGTFKSHFAYVILSLIWLGAPMGPAFFIEELLIHSFLETGVTQLICLATGFAVNSVLWYRLYITQAFVFIKSSKEAW